VPPARRQMVVRPRCQAGASDWRSVHTVSRGGRERPGEGPGAEAVDPTASREG
jgi:hypothetical protein